MALQADVRYVRYNVDGTAARKIQRNAETENVTPVYKRRKTEHKVIAVDPVALVGIALSAIMLVAMAVGLVHYHVSLQQSREINAYVARLEQEKAELEQTYRAGYDLDEIREIAQQAGMIPAEQIEEVTLTEPMPVAQEAEMSFWDTLTTFLAGIFA